MASLYDCLRLCHGLDSDADSFFARMRDEEIRHGDLVREERRIMFHALENYLDLVDYDQDALERTLTAIEDLVSGAAGLTLEEVLGASLALKREATTRHCLSAVSRAHPSLGGLVRSLGDADREHAARLESFARSRGIALQG
jgi:hypothetical protein